MLAPEDDVAFSALVVGDPEPVVLSQPPVRPEILLGVVTIRLEDGTSADRIVEVGSINIGAVSPPSHPLVKR